MRSPKRHSWSPRTRRSSTSTCRNARRARYRTTTARRSRRSKATMSSTDDALSEIERILAAGGDADDVLRGVVHALHASAGYGWAGISFVEDGELQLGPQAGTRTGTPLTTVPVMWQGERVAELGIGDAPEEDRIFLERVADLVAGHCLVGWDTGGESWEP